MENRENKLLVFFNLTLTVSSNFDGKSTCVLVIGSWGCGRGEPRSS